MVRWRARLKHKLGGSRSQRLTRWHAEEFSIATTAPRVTASSQLCRSHRGFRTHGTWRVQKYSPVFISGLHLGGWGYRKGVGRGCTRSHYSPADWGWRYWPRAAVGRGTALGCMVGARTSICLWLTRLLAWYDVGWWLLGSIYFVRTLHGPVRLFIRNVGEPCLFCSNFSSEQMPLISHAAADDDDHRDEKYATDTGKYNHSYFVLLFLRHFCDHLVI
jgi:hypothetical protein